MLTKQEKIIIKKIMKEEFNSKAEFIKYISECRYPAGLTKELVEIRDEILKEKKNG